MSIEELYNLCNWIETNIQKKEIYQKYQALFSVMNQNAQANRQQQPFENQKVDVINALKEINLHQLSDTQIAMLNKLNILQFIGTNGIEKIESNLYINSLDIATAASNINKFSSELNQGLTKANQIKTGLAHIADDIEYDDTATMRVRFAGDVSINDIVTLKKLSALWYDIGRGIAMYHNEPPESIKVKGAENGSIILVLGVSTYIIKTFSDVVLRILSVHEKIIDIKIKKQELKKLNLTNQKIEGELNNEIEGQKDKLLEDIMEYLITNREDEVNGELKDIIEKSIKKTVDFIEKGGELDITLNEDDDTEKSTYDVITKIKENTVEIRRIEDKIKLIEMSSDN